VHLIQLLLPLYDNAGSAMPESIFRGVAAELTDRFGGLTAYTRAPAVGLWQEGSGRTRRDEIIVYEVMADTIDRAWWRQYRTTLERTFRQDEIVVRGHAVDIL
jgi:hypothetical protein